MTLLTSHPFLYRVYQSIGILTLLLISSTVVGCATATHTTKISKSTVYTLREAYNNIHIIRTGSQLVMIDAGLERSAPRVEERIRNLGLDPKKLKAIIVTHGHADHAGGAQYFRKKYGTRIIAGHGDQELLKKGRNDELCPTDSRGRSSKKEHQSETYTPYSADVWIKKDTDLEPLIGIPGKIITLPGHTKGSIVVVIDNAAYVGDLFRGGIVGSSANMHFYMCDQEGNKRDIRKLLKTYPKIKTYFTGHFGPVSRAAVASFVAAKK